MFGKLKEMAGSATVDKAIANFEPMLREHLDKAQALGAEVIGDDVRYAKFVVEPAYLAVVSASHGVSKLIPEFKERFGRVMLHARNELLAIEGSGVRLVDDFKDRLPKVLSDGFKS